MPIPSIELPTYSVYLPTLEKEIKFRPFLVKEEKVLLIALESGDAKTILNATKQVIQNCILTEGVLVDSIPLNEIELLYINLRARSMGETVELEYVCENVINDKKCKGQVMIVVNLLEVALEQKKINNTIKLTDHVGIKLKFPNMDSSEIISKIDGNPDDAIKLIEKCTEYLFDEDQVYKPTEMQEGEFSAFIEGLTQPQLKQIKQYFKDIPKIKHIAKSKCIKCKGEHTIQLEGLLDFFE